MSAERMPLVLQSLPRRLRPHRHAAALVLSFLGLGLLAPQAWAQAAAGTSETPAPGGSPPDPASTSAQAEPAESTTSQESAATREAAVAPSPSATAAGSQAPHEANPDAVVPQSAVGSPHAGAGASADVGAASGRDLGASLPEGDGLPEEETEELSEEDLQRYMADNGLGERGVKVPSFDIYGFADFSYWQYLIPSDSPWRFIYSSDGTFAVGNLNLYFDATLTQTLRSLIEVRFAYLPFGEITDFGTTVDRDIHQSSDYTRNERDIIVGGVNIARAYLEWEAHPLLHFKLGQWLTPYGIWNVDHGTPVIIPANRPFIIDEQLLPEAQTGILAEGRVDLPDRWGVEYGLGISNGRRPVDRFMDMDSNRAVTGRLRATFGGIGDLSFGVSGYVGQYTYKQTSLTIKSSGELASVDTILEQYDEVSFGADARWLWKGLHLQSEFLLNDRGYTDDGRTLGSRPGTLSPDIRRWGVYGLAGYRFDWFGVMPYVTVEYSPVPNTNIVELPRKTIILSGGFNVRPVAALVVKLGYMGAFFPEARPGTFDEHPLHRLTSQVAWAF